MQNAKEVRLDTRRSRSALGGTVSIKRKLPTKLCAKYVSPLNDYFRIATLCTTPTIIIPINKKLPP